MNLSANTYRKLIKFKNRLRGSSKDNDSFHRKIKRIKRLEKRLLFLFGIALLSSPINAQEFQVNDETEQNQQYPCIGSDTQGNFVFAWKSSDGIYAQLYDYHGNVILPAFYVNTYKENFQNKPHVSMNEHGDFVMCWQSFDQDGDGYGVYMQRYSKTGTRVNGEVQVNEYTNLWQESADVAMDAAGNVIVVWQSKDQDGSGYGIYAKIYNADGQVIAPEFRVNSTTEGSQESPVLAMDAAGNVIVVWQSKDQDGSGYGIFAKKIDISANIILEEFQVNTYVMSHQKSPSISIGKNDEFIVAWQSFGQDGSQDGIFAQRFASDGTPIGLEFQVNSFTDYPQSNCHISANKNGSFIVTWESLSAGSSKDIFVRKFNESAEPEGVELKVNHYVQNIQQRPFVEMNDWGDYMLAWESYGQDGSGYGIFAHNYQEPNQNPVNIQLSNQSLLENNEQGAVVAQIEVMDPDDNDYHTLTFNHSMGGEDNAAFDIIDNQLIIKEVSNFEAKNRYSVRLTAVDKRGSSVTKSFRIEVRDVNESPTLDDIETLRIPNDQQLQELILTGIGPGPEADQSLQITAISDNENLIAHPEIIYQEGSNEALLRLLSASNATGIVNITIKVQDNGGTLLGGVDLIEKNFQIEIYPANNPPNAINLSQHQILENQEPGSVVGLLSVQDQDINDTHTISMVEGQEWFEINQNQELVSKIKFDFEVRSTYSLLLKVADQGGLSFTQAVTIYIKDVNEIPTLNEIEDIQISQDRDSQAIFIEGISSGPEADQEVQITASAEDASILSAIEISEISDGQSVLKLYHNHREGETLVTITVADNGGTDNGGRDRFSRQFLVKVLPKLQPEEDQLVHADPNNERINLYPNPAQESITFKSDFDSLVDQKLSCRIFSQQGVLVKNYEFDFDGNINLDIKDLKRGVYIIEITSKNGKIKKKLIKI